MCDVVCVCICVCKGVYMGVHVEVRGQLLELILFTFHGV